jgi:thymidine kinase
VGYEVLCRRHHMRRMTASAARAASPSPQTLDLAPAAQGRLPLDA